MPALLVRLPNHLGDACMALPALDLLARRGFELTLAGKAWSQSLFSAYPWAVLALPPGRAERTRALRGWHMRHARAQGLLLTNSLSTAAEFRLAGLRPIGYATDARRLLLARAVPVPRPLADVHMVAYYHDLAAQFAAGDRVELPRELGLRLSADARDRARRMLEAAGIDGPYVVLCPVATGLHRGKVKAWPGFGHLCEALIARGERVVVCPGPGEREAVMHATPRATLLPETDVAIFAALLAGSRLVVANDSGPGHVAAAVGANLVSVFGVTEPARTRPWGSRVTIVGSELGWPRDEDAVMAVEKALRDGGR